MENKYVHVLVALVAVYAFSVSEAQSPYSLNCSCNYFDQMAIYFDQMAQSYCAASTKTWTFAIRRDCARAPTCNAICQQAKSEILGVIGNQRNKVKCYDAFSHVKPNSEADQPDEARVSMGTYGYGAKGCTWRANHCGPNYCCCQAY